MDSLTEGKYVPNQAWETLWPRGMFLPKAIVPFVVSLGAWMDCVILCADMFDDHVEVATLYPRIWSSENLTSLLELKIKPNRGRRIGLCISTGTYRRLATT